MASDTKLKEISSFRRVLPQILASTAKNLLLLDLGMAVSFPTIVIPALRGLKEHDSNDILSFTAEQASWFASIAFIFQPIGSVASGIVLEPLGRKKSMILVNIPHIIAWSMLHYASSLTELYIAAILLGLGVGFMEAPIITYVGEICEPSIRGILTACAGVAVMIGFSLVYFLGSVTTWRFTALLCCSVPICTAIAICFVPETPFWLLAKNRKEEALKSLMWLRGWVSSPKYVEKEFNEIVKYSEESNRCVACHKSDSKCTHPPATAKELLTELKRKRTLKPFFIVLMMFIFAQFSGLSAMRPYLVQIFQAYSSPIDPSWSTFVIGVMGFFANIACMCLIKPIGKRKIALISMAGTCISVISLAMYSFFILPPGLTSFDKHLIHSTTEHNLGYIPMTFIYLFAFFTSFGLLPVPWMLLSEVFPFKSRGLASGITAAINYTMAFITTKTYYNLESSLSLFGVIALYAVIDCLGLLFIYFYLPETEKHTLEDIELHFSDNTKKLRDIQIQRGRAMAKGIENKAYESDGNKY
ncbi:hypothetical protein PVAND_010037 [Polypedilum vanderplanki]|uniref:Major facilitator superfamily (MFS) profile domain-containing protein n=1 Tax=Polypedilum vanderplanki TaxID=319348 RepID=A0A9J6CEM0_POLVA|nr:hypothetical protein PVAND_010037 [Polypedilum vanderplanki]